MRTIRIVNAAVARTHEQVGLREPAHRTSEVRAIDRKDLEILAVQVSHPAGNIRGLAIPGIGTGIPIGGEPGLACGKLFQSAEREPRLITRLPPASHRRQKITHDRHGQNRTDDSVEEQSNLREQSRAVTFRLM